MPPLARALGLILAIGGLSGPAANAFGPNQQAYGPPGAAAADPSRSHPGWPGRAEPTRQQDPGTGTAPRFGPPSAVVPVAHHVAADQVAQPAVAPIPLGPPRQNSAFAQKPSDPANQGQRDRALGLPSVVTVGGSLAVVLGIFFLVAWGMRRAAPPGSVMLPGEVFEVLGRAPVASRQQVHLLRCGAKLLLVSVTPEGAETLTEITDPIEVDRLAGLCQQARPNSATAAFRQVFGQFSGRSSQEGPFDGRGHEDAGLADLGLPVGKQGGL